MKNWVVSDIRWASVSDLKLPFWVDWNKKNPLPSHFWQRIWEYPYVALQIPSSDKSLDIGGNAANVPFEDNSFDYTFSISAVEETPDLFAVIKEMIRLARHRVVITINVSDKPDSPYLPLYILRELEEFLGVHIPRLPHEPLNSVSPVLEEFGQQCDEEFRHIRVLGFTLDSRDVPKSVAILVPHWESWQFLKPCLEAVQQNRNEALVEKVYVLDDASADGSFEKAQETFKDDKNIEFHRFERPNRSTEPDVGLLFDNALKFVNEQYIVTIDADTFPLSKDWITFPIWLLETYGCSSVGSDTGSSVAYIPQATSRSWWQTYTGDWRGYWITGGLFDNDVFTVANNMYHVMRTALAKVVSESVGFTMATGTADRYPYLPGRCDNGVAASHFIDLNRMGPKFNIPLTTYIGLTPHDGAFGQNYAGLVFHFALSARALSQTRRDVADAGEPFMYWVSRLQEYEGLHSKCLKEMIEASTHFQPGGYDGSVPISWYEREYAYIQRLFERFRRQS